MNAPIDPRHETFKADGLTCIRGQRVVFSDLSFAIPPGTATVLRGPNGSGKSSLLRLVAGLLKPATGTMRWGDDAARPDPEFHRRQVGFVGHQDAIKPAFTVGENLLHWRAILGGRGDETGIATALAAHDLSHLADLPARLLSAGQRRRLNLARLNLVPRQLWLLDEPTVSLDDDSVARLETCLRRHLDNQGSALIATHAPLNIGPSAAIDLAPATMGALDG
ncbi:MAG: heme ABC exporter ATP-binding protein CcmA [Alphaproteobacteria bacterium]